MFKVSHTDKVQALVKNTNHNIVTFSHGINARLQDRRAEDNKCNKVVASAEANPECSASTEEKFGYFWGRIDGQ